MSSFIYNLLLFKLWLTNTAINSIIIDVWKIKYKNLSVKGGVILSKNFIIGNLDYNISTLEDRLTKVEEIIENNEDGLIEYFDERYNPSLSQNSALSENDQVCKQLERMADYLLYAENKEEKEDVNVLKKNRINKIKKREMPSDKTSVMLECGTGTTTEKKNVIKEIDLRVKKEDRQKFDELFSMGRAIGYLRFSTINNFKPDNRITDEEYVDIAHMSKKQIEKLVDRFDEDYIDSHRLTDYESRLYKKTEINLYKEEKIMNNLLHGYFTFSDEGKTSILLDDNTGYYNEDGEYVEVTDNKVEMTNSKHVYEFIKHYSDLKEYVFDNMRSDTMFMIYDLEDSIEGTQLRDFEKEIVIMIVDKMQQAEMLEVLSTKYQMTISQSRLSQIISSIMKKISEHNKKKFRDWAVKKYKIN